MLDQLTMERFEKLGEKRFRLDLGEGEALDLTMIEVAPMGSKSKHAARQAFSVLFRGPAEPMLAQQIYPLAHDELGTLELFLVPVGPDEGGMLYEAVFT